jgi:hypothetical protein
MITVSERSVVSPLTGLRRAPYDLTEVDPLLRADVVAAPAEYGLGVSGRQVVGRQDLADGVVLEGDISTSMVLSTAAAATTVTMRHIRSETLVTVFQLRPFTATSPVRPIHAHPPGAVRETSGPSAWSRT